MLPICKCAVQFETWDLITEYKWKIYCMCDGRYHDINLWRYDETHFQVTSRTGPPMVTSAAFKMAHSEIEFYGVENVIYDDMLLCDISTTQFIYKTSSLSNVRHKLWREAVSITISESIFWLRLTSFATDYPCGVWCRGWTICILYVGPFFGNVIWNDSGFVGFIW